MNPMPVELNIDSIWFNHLKLCWCLVFKRYINLYKTQLSLFSFTINLLQKAIIRSFTRISSGNRQSSPYIIKCGVVFLTFKIRFQNFNWICSITFKFSYPHTSEPYSKIGSIIEQGRIQDFKLGAAHLKKLRRAEGGAKIFWVFRVKNPDFTPKNHIFSNFSTFYNISDISWWSILW
jgi:hypothetical protein